MATSTTQNFTTMPAPPTATLFAEMCYGSNGSDGGSPELVIGNTAQDASTGRITWDDSDDAFDTGNVSFAVVIPAGGGSADPDSLEVVGAVTDPILYSLITYALISAVVVEVGVQINASVTISSLVVQFSKGGTITDSFDLTTGPAVDTTSATNPVAAQVVTIVPSQRNNDSVQVSGILQMTAPSGTFPDVNDLFAQIFIQTHAPSGSHPGRPPIQPGDGTVTQ